MKRAVALAALLALAFSPTAAAHGGGGARGYRSTVTAVKPATPGIDVRVLDSDDRLVLTNKTGKTVVVQGYRGEPYLRFTSGAAYRNRRSPATYLNDDRYGAVELPDQADPKASPDWAKVADEPTYEWHDHRIHWMSPVDPPQIRRAKDRPHHVFDWTVPLEVDRRNVAIAGTLDYTPPPSSSFNPLLLLPLALTGLAGAAFWWRRRRAG